MSNHNSCGLCSIEMKNISVTSGEDILLDNINLTFHCGELTALIGKNGAGKTTLLRTLLGERHYKGSISFTDHHGVVLPMPRIGYVPQHLDFDKSMPISVSDFIAAAKGGSPVWFGKQNKMQAHIREILEDMECGYLAERRLGALRGGMSGRSPDAGRKQLKRYGRCLPAGTCRPDAPEYSAEQTLLRRLLFPPRSARNDSGSHFRYPLCPDGPQPEQYFVAGGRQQGNTGRTAE